MSRVATCLIGLALATLLGALASGAVRRVQDERALAGIWEDVEQSRWQAVLASTDSLLAPDAISSSARGRVAELRCWALLATGRRDECAVLLDQVLAEKGAPQDWLPDPMLTRIAIAHRGDRGHLQAAAELARRASRAYPADVSLLRIELASRAAVEDESSVLAEFEARLDLRPESLPLRVALASRHRHRAAWAASLRVLGDAPPAAGSPLLAPWFEERSTALAALGRLQAVRDAFQDWAGRGGNAAELQARYALRLSVSQLPDPDATWSELLRKALAQGDAIGEARLQTQLYERLIAHHLADGRHDEALVVFDEAEAVGFALPGITREQLERGASLVELGDTAGEAALARIVLRIPAALAGGEIAVSDARSEPDAPFERFTLAAPASGGEIAVEVSRGVAAWPERWVLFDSAGLVRSSGSVWATRGRRTEVVVRVGDAQQPSAARKVSRAAADGHSRVFALVLDCGDWRLIQYLRERGELPALESLLARGHSAVLSSDPPLTAAAMESLVWPERQGVDSFVGLVHELGVEMSGLSSVGRNPFGFLDGFLSGGSSLFETLGSGQHVAANMLFTHGLIEAGRHAEMVGPQGKRRWVETARAQRPLRPAELSAYPGIDLHPQSRSHVESIAAELDAASDLASAGEVDLLMLRVESLDILTHALFSELATTRQDDGASNLLAVYRYIDRRLGELEDLLDADDVLVAFSDHGIRTAMEHQDDAFFVAVGAPIGRGRASGRPAIGGVPRALADMLGVATSWPDTGLRPLRSVAGGGSPGRI